MDCQKKNITDKAVSVNGTFIKHNRQEMLASSNKDFASPC